MATDMFLTVIDTADGQSGLLHPLIGKHGSTVRADGDLFRAERDGGKHQTGVTVAEMVLEVYAISVFKLDRLITAAVLVRINGEPEITGFSFGLAEHPFVEKQVIITLGGRHKSNLAALRPGCRLACFIDGLGEVILAFYNPVPLIIISYDYFTFENSTV